MPNNLENVPAFLPIYQSGKWVLGRGKRTNSPTNAGREEGKTAPRRGIGEYRQAIFQALFAF
jgi:hypothetical protein